MMGMPPFGALVLGNLSMAVSRVLSCGLYPRITPVTNSHDKTENGFNAHSLLNELRYHMESSTLHGLVRWFVNGPLNVAELGVPMCMLLRHSPAQSVGGGKKGLISKALRPTI